MAPFDWGIPLLEAGLVAGLAGFLSLWRPLRFPGIRTRRAGAAVAAFGLFTVLAGILWPAPLRSPGGPRTRLDDFIPSFQFHEVHEIRIHASAGDVFRAIHSVTAGEIRFFRALTWLRSPRIFSSRVDILAAPPDRPLLDVAFQSGFVPLAEDPGREFVFGAVFGRRLPGSAEWTPREFAAFSRPGFCKVAMNFRAFEEGGGFVRLSTETRVLALDRGSRTLFAAYWRLIAPGSAFIRRMWLAAIRRRAEERP